MISQLHLPGFPQFEVGSLDQVIDETYIAWAENFSDYVEQLQELNADDSVPRLIIAANLDFMLPDQVTYPDQVTHRSMTRFQICRWLVDDQDVFANHKPVHIKGMNSYRELRLISGLPTDQIQTAEAIFEGLESESEAALDAFDYFTSVGDYLAVLRLLKAFPDLTAQE